MKMTVTGSALPYNIGSLIVALLLTIGCNAKSHGTLYAGDAQKVAEAIEDLNDTKTNKRFANAFAKGAAPKEQKKYRVFDYGVVGRPTVKGATATVEVALTKNYSEVGKQTWTLEKEGEAWKIKSAPLP